MPSILGFVRAEKHGRKIYELHDPHVARLLGQAIAHAEHLKLQAGSGEG